MDVPFLDCSDLAVFKAFFNRSKDWVDLAVMLYDGTLDADRVIGVLTEYLGRRRRTHPTGAKPEAGVLVLSNLVADRGP